MARRQFTKVHRKIVKKMSGKDVVKGLKWSLGINP